MFKQFPSFTKQGNVGLAYAIAYYSKLGYTISIPLTDSQDYDLIVDDGKSLLKIQVKTTYAKAPSGFYIANLRVCGGNRSGKGKAKLFSKNDCDYVFVMTDNASLYSIPRIAILNTTTLTLNEDMDKYKVLL